MQGEVLLGSVQSLPPSTESAASKAVLVQPAMPSQRRLQSRLGSGDMKPSGRDLLKVVDGSVLLDVAMLPAYMLDDSYCQT